MLAKVFIGKNGGAAFMDRLQMVIREKCFVDVHKNLGNNDEFNYFYHYMVLGCIGIFRAWLDGGIKETPLEMAELTKKLILSGVSALK